MPKLSLCMIVRDEAERLPDCLRSARAVVDEMIVVDTGSTDATVQVARELGAQVETFAWCNDFARARNVALAAATGDWALVLDADERLLEPADARAKLEDFTGAHPGSVGRVLIENHTEAALQSTVSIGRFLPLGRGILYTGRIHEQLARQGAPTLDCAATGLVLRHDGYSERTLRERSKLERNIKLCELALEDDPTDSYLAWQLGRTLALANEHDAALQAFEVALAHCPDGASWGPLLVESTASTLRALERQPQALGLLTELAALAPSRPDRQFLEALCRMDLGQFDAAEQGFLRCLELGPAAPGSTESSPSAATWAAAHNLGVLCECLSRPDEARGWYERALAFLPSHEPSHAGLQRLREAA